MFCSFQNYVHSQENNDNINLVIDSALWKNNNYYLQELVKGRCWYNTTYGVKGHPFFNSKNVLNGCVTVKNLCFTNVLLIYDLFKDELLLEFRDDNEVGNLITLNKKSVTEFNLYDGINMHYFKNSDTENFIKTDFFSGFVEILYDGEYTLYCKWFKKISKLAIENKYDKFVLKSNLYLKTDGEIIELKNRNDFISFFGKKGFEIKKIERKNNLKVSINDFSSLVKMLKLVELTNSN